MNDPYVEGQPLVFIACPLVSSVVDELIIMSLGRYLKPSADSGGTHRATWGYFLIPMQKVVSLLGQLWLLLTKK